MRVVDTGLPGAVLLEPERHVDDRGFFARLFCVEEFGRLGLVTAVAQCSTSWTRRAGTIRGMHFQREPFGEDRLVRCSGGAIYDVIVDLREGSPTFLRWAAYELSAQNGLSVFMPKGFAHGFQTLTDGAEVFYQMSTPYVPDAASGVRWDDPAIGIRWPLAVSSVSKKDRTWPDMGALSPKRARGCGCGSSC